MALYLSFKEVWRNRGRFLLFSLVIALITTLVLFIAALAGGLASANREYLAKLDADLLVYQANSDFLIAASRIPRAKTADLRRQPGVAAVGPLGFSTATIALPGRDPLDVSLIGVEPGEPGEPPVIHGRQLRGSRSREAVIDARVVEALGIEPGDRLLLKSTQGTEEQFFELLVAGHTDRQQYQFLPAVFVPFQTWDRIRPQASIPSGSAELIPNILAVRLTDPARLESVQAQIGVDVRDVMVADKQKAIESIPGYSVQQSTLNTQQAFTLLIGVLVLGGFFQIQTLQKIGQIGMLKAIGAANRTVAAASLWQIVGVTTLGVLLGTVGTFLISLSLPAQVPIQFDGPSILGAILLLLLIGPLGGLVSIRLALRVDPLTAIGQ
jgi:putative ABC transport system permease protein